MHLEVSTDIVTDHRSNSAILLVKLRVESFELQIFSTRKSAQNFIWLIEFY